MKKISNLAGIVAASALLCGIFGCDNTETITMTSASIEMVGDPIVTDKAAIFQWKKSLANEIVISRQASGEEEVFIDYGFIYNGIADRVWEGNPLKAGVEYTYRFYNTSDVSAARKAYTLEKKYSCVERKVKFASIAPAGSNLSPLTEEQVKITKYEGNGTNYVSVYVDEKEAGVWLNIYDKTDDRWYYDLYNLEVGGIKAFEYDSSHAYEITVGKWWPGADEDHKYYINKDTEKVFALGAANAISLEIETWNDSFTATWTGKKDSQYEVSFKAYDNKGATVNLTKSKITDKIENDDFYNYRVTGKLSTYIDISKHVSFKYVTAVLKETAGSAVSESESEKEYIDAHYTTYTSVDRGLRGNYYQDSETYKYVTTVTLSGHNLPNTAKLYYKKSWESFYNQVDFKKDGDNFTATLNLDQEPTTYEHKYYDFKAMVSVANDKMYDWYEGKTEEVVEDYYFYKTNDPKDNSDESYSE